MNTFKLSKARVQLAFTIMLAVLVIVVFASVASQVGSASETNSVSSLTNSVDLKASPTNSVKVVLKHQLTGAELYSINCNRCHPERYPTERTGSQWKTIMLHMQIRANIPVGQAKLILQYLQENSGR